MCKKAGTLFVIAAPSGAGKTSLIRTLVERDDNLIVSISHTTRPPRPDEKDGQAYYFVDETTFKSMIRQNRFLEYARIFGSYYGTSRDQIEALLASGRNIILEIDWQGARQVTSQMKGCVGIFILPPNYTALEERLYKRKNDSPEVIKKRMNMAREEILHYTEFDYIVVNDDFEYALAEIMAIITAVNLDRRRQSTYYDKIATQLVAQTD